jgi:hypothetical protein
MTNFIPLLDLTDVIIEAMPFSDELVEWCKKHPNFKSGLKFDNSDEFLALGLILTSPAPPHKLDDEVIGFLVYDMRRKVFKQDFIVNIGKKSAKFILYSKRPDKKYDEHSQHINSFYVEYGANGRYYKNTHHYTVDQAKLLNKDEKFQERLESTLRIANNIEQHGLNKITQVQLQAAIVGIQQEKKKKHIDWI